MLQHNAVELTAKYEARNPKQIRMQGVRVLDFRFRSLRFVSDFELRISRRPLRYAEA